MRLHVSAYALQRALLSPRRLMVATACHYRQLGAFCGQSLRFRSSKSSGEAQKIVNRPDNLPTYSTRQYAKGGHNESSLSPKNQSSVTEFIPHSRLIDLNEELSDQEFHKYMQKLEPILTNLPRNRILLARCFAVGIGAEVYRRAISAFRADLLDGKLDLTLKHLIIHMKARSNLNRILLPEILKYFAKMEPAKALVMSAMLESTDLTSPTELFPAARRMDRKIILHVGPTNSGKTYSALSRFENCASGLYCGPLRLLAHEIYDKMNRKGVPCNLLTGEERRESDDVDLYSATVEMAPLNRIYDVAIIDEIQMINDEHRGWAWTQALLGLQAREIHLCGESTVVDLIKRICASIGEDVEVNQYNRLTSLHLSPSLDGQFGNVKKGDAVVTFSRRNIFAVKKHIEESTGFKCAVIYGSLPPETRAEQARLFNEPGSGFDVLVASDAIGMGLNLNIKRIVFERLTKFDGEVSRYLSVSQVKQIAGRAGRFGTEHPEGYVCALDDIDHERLKYYMNADLPLVETAGLLPTLEQVEEFSNKFPSMGFTSLLERYEDLSRLDGDYFLCNLRNQKEVATLLENKPLELRDRFIFTNAPHSVDGGFADKCMMLFVDAFIERRECPIDQKIVLPRQPPATIEALRVIEGMHKIITLYLWLSVRFPTCFTDTEKAAYLKRNCERLINLSLVKLSFQRSKKKGLPRDKSAYKGSATIAPGLEHIGRTEWKQAKPVARTLGVFGDLSSAPSSGKSVFKEIIESLEEDVMSRKRYDADDGSSGHPDDQEALENRQKPKPDDESIRY